MCDLHEAAERLRAEQRRRDRIETVGIALSAVLASAVYAASLLGWL